MDPIKSADRRVANIYTAAFRPIETDGKPDGEVLQLNDAKPLGAGFYVYRMAPGQTTVAHRHKGDEEFLIIEGDLTDNDGTEYGPGDLVWLRDGTEHHSTTKGGCLIAVFAEMPDDFP
ncbi:cupin domain-containing protein [Roseovarius nanhaiticus]|uniref:ChrR Cupin-like domain-containing protein n=1 Tax=Roseovarius nanhaiticus TaxID=573024 RepID=A0A1N7F8L5_9RHOB|nr:cupin domain-containing protein [Roseovarius nanhaiticus]SEK59648.1 ChrR Cupin-like domain-containing protein [Roseovarius nanhaiticus]SIR96555.1 ChrR Cupin-like domain-containing protein [Roseovarius nanhaiticus]